MCYGNRLFTVQTIVNSWFQCFFVSIFSLVLSLTISMLRRWIAFLVFPFWYTILDCHYRYHVPWLLEYSFQRLRTMKWRMKTWIEWKGEQKRPFRKPVNTITDDNGTHTHMYLWNPKDQTSTSLANHIKFNISSSVISFWGSYAADSTLFSLFWVTQLRIK